MGKILETRKLYKEMIHEVTKNTNNWLSFLDSSSWNFKYDFDDQILIYAQRPDAKACASIDEWNKKLRRWVNKGTKPIYVRDKNPFSEYPFRLVFDLSDTHNYNNTEYKLWTIKKEYEKDIIESLEANFDATNHNGSLWNAITDASYNMVIDNIEDYLTSIINNKPNSNLQEFSDDEIKNLLIPTVWASVSYMIMTRCNLKPLELIAKQEFSYIKYFDKEEIITILGSCVSDIAEMGLREIAKTVNELQKNEKFKNYTIENIKKEIYDKEKIKGGIEDGRENRIHETGGLLFTESNNEERESTSREIFTNEIQLPKESQELRTNEFSNEREIDGTSNRNTEYSKSESGTINSGDGEKGERDRRIESSRPDEMGGLDEQLENDSGGDSDERTDLRLKNDSKRRILTNEEMKSDKDYLQDKYQSALLSNIQNLKVARTEIKDFFKNHQDEKERTEYIKQVFSDSYTEIVVDDVRLGYKTYENVLHLWKDDYLNRTAEVYIKWEMVANYIEGMILVNEFNDMHKPIQTYDDQMQILQVEAENAPTFSFSQELIDYALAGGGNIRESKMRIYHQFENSLSTNENIKFLKNEYGWGGSSSIHSGTRVGIDYDGKGITLYRGYEDNAPRIALNWNKVEKRIGELIKEDRYLNSKEKANYKDWLKEQEQEKELQEAEDKLANQKEQQEYELAKRIYEFVKPSDLYNYLDNRVSLNADEENIEIVKADINDSKNVEDYVNSLKKTNETLENSNSQKHEIQELISILEKRVPHYEYHLGDIVYIGADEYEIAGIKDNVVTLYDPKFPLFTKQIDFEEFERKVKDNYSNEHLIIKETEDIEQELIDNVEITENSDIEKADEISKIIDNQSEKEVELQPKEKESNIEKIEDIKPNFAKKKNKIQDFILHPEIAESDRNNYKITDNDLGVGTPKEKFKRNIEAIKILKKCEDENRYATPEEQEILSKYVGWGGLQEAFDENKDNWKNEYTELKNLLTDDEYQNARASVLTAFYTPPVVINSIYEILQNMGLKEANILEPACRSRKFFWNVTK